MWDDQWAVMNYYTEGDLTFNNLWRILIEFYHGQYAPLNQYLYLLLYTFFGYNPFFYHLVSMLIHLTNACLVYYMLKKLFMLSGRIDVDRVNILSFLTALIFTIHTINTEAVCWMSASKVPLYALFYFGATITFLLYIERKKKVYYLVTLLLFTLSFLAKDQAVTFPLWALLIYWFLNRKIVDKKIWLEMMPFFLLSVLFGIITLMSQSVTGRGLLSNEQTYPFFQRIIIGIYTFIEYFTKSLIPFKLSYLYPFPVVMGDSLPNWMLFYPSLLIIAVFGLWRYLKQWMITFGLIFFVIHIFIVLNIVQLSRFSIFADRYNYIAMIGIGLVISYFVVLSFDKLKGYKKNLLSIFFVFYLLYLGIYSNLRVRDWYDTDTIKKEMRDLLKQRDDYNQ